MQGKRDSPSFALNRAIRVVYGKVVYLVAMARLGLLSRELWVRSSPRLPVTDQSRDRKPGAVPA